MQFKRNSISIYPKVMYSQKTRLTMENGSSRGFPIIVVEHPAQFIAAADAAHLGEARRRLDQFWIP